jgi:hypothetical protein
MPGRFKPGDVIAYRVKDLAGTQTIIAEVQKHTGKDQSQVIIRTIPGNVSLLIPVDIPVLVPMYWQDTFKPVKKERRSMSGKIAFEEVAEPVDITLNSRCPTKWLAVDMETGEIWHAHPDSRFRRATQKFIEELKHIVSGGSARKDRR